MRTGKRNVYRVLFALVCLILICWAYYHIWFLRQPARSSPGDQSVFVSPANGRVVAVTAWDSAQLVLKKDLGIVRVLTADVASKGMLVAIEMDITNVHYQRAPVESHLVNSAYRKGAFRNALIRNNDFGFRLENEHNALLFETPRGLRFKVVQIAGLLARRITDYVDPGQVVAQGDIIGLIYLGSQVVLILPQGVDITVKPGDKVIDGETIVAKIP